MTPCSKLYGYLGQHLARAYPQANHAYRDWILTYSSASYNALPAAKEVLLNRLGKGRVFGEPCSGCCMHTREIRNNFQCMSFALKNYRRADRGRASNSHPLMR